MRNINFILKNLKKKKNIEGTDDCDLKLKKKFMETELLFHKGHRETYSFFFKILSIMISYALF